MNSIEEKQSSHIAALLRASDRDLLSEILKSERVSPEMLRTLLGTIDAAIYRELKSIADYISFLRSEISALQPNDMRAKRIPAAGEELSAVVSATEAAGNAIMTRAEAVMSAEPADLVDFKAFVDEQMLGIFEACSFQDLTGQRITKVVKTLEQIETRVSRFAVATNANDSNGYADDNEATDAERRERLLIHGPSLAGDGMQQNEVDQIIDDEPKIASQGDIDKLFV
jgi:chemotaxis protein CheZ